MPGSTHTPTEVSTLITTTGGAGNHDTVTFDRDAEYVELLNLGSTRVSLLVDPGSTNPTIDGDGTIPLPAGGSLLEPSVGSSKRAATVVKAISATPVEVSIRLINPGTPV